VVRIHRLRLTGVMPTKTKKQMRNLLLVIAVIFTVGICHSQGVYEVDTSYVATENYSYKPSIKLIDATLISDRLDENRICLQELKDTFNNLSYYAKLSSVQKIKLNKRVDSYKKWESKTDLSIESNYSYAYNYLDDSIDLMKSYK